MDSLKNTNFSAFVGVAPVNQQIGVTVQFRVVLFWMKVSSGEKSSESAN